MNASVQIGILTIGDLRLLAYAQYMAKTAQSGAARRLFAAYVEQEKQWLEQQEIRMKAFVDQDTCTGCGLCIEACPEVFEMKNGTAKVRVRAVPVACETTCREAMKDCPVAAIAIEA